MTTTKIPTLDQYWEGLAAGLPQFSREEQRAAVTLYRDSRKVSLLTPHSLPKR